MGTMSGDADHDFYQSSRWAWHALFGLVVALAAAFLTADGSPGWTPLLAALVVAYVVAFARIIQSPDRRNERPYRIAAVGYLALAYAMAAVLAWVDPNALVLLFMLFPQTFVALELRYAVASAVLLSALYTVVLLARSGWTAQALRTEGLGGVLTAVFAVAIGAFITGLVRQGDRRNQMIAELTAARSQRDEARRAAGAAAERERLGREIHDTLAQGFMSVVMLGQAARAALSAGDVAAADRRLGQIDAAAREGLDEARALIRTTQPAALDGQTLETALRRLVARFGAETGITSSFSAEGATAAARSARDDVVLLRAAQEALSNVRRHAAANEVRVSLTAGPAGTTLAVADDGCGFDPSRPVGGCGLAGMRARAAEVGGKVEIDSCRGGTTIRVLAGSPSQNSA